MYKNLVSLVLLASSFIVTAESAHIYDQYLFDSKTKAKTLVNLTFNGKVKVESVEPAPLGMFQVLVKHDDGEFELVYVLQDLKHIMRGVLYSPYITDSESANGSEYFERIAKDNSQRMEMISQFLPTNNTEKKSKTSADKIKKKATVNNFLNRQKLNQVASKNLFPSGLKVGMDEQALYERLEKTEFVPMGNQDKYLYVFYDHHCSGCIKAETYLRKYSEQYNIGIRYIPMSAFLNDPEGELKATAVLLPEDGARRLELKNSFLGKAKAKSKMTKEEYEHVTSNSERFNQMKAIRKVHARLLQQYPRPATPAALFQSKHGIRALVLANGKQIKDVFEEMSQ